MILTDGLHSASGPAEPLVPVRESSIDSTLDTQSLLGHEEAALWDIVHFSIIDFDFLWQRPQQLMREIWRRGARVLFVEPPAIELRSGGPAKFIQRGGRLRSPAKNFHLYKPLATLYMLRQLPSAFTGTRCLLSVIEISRLVRNLGFGSTRPLVTWISDPFLFTPYLDHIFRASTLVVYDRMDHWASFERLRSIRNLVIEREKQIIGGADLVLAPSEGLLDEVAQLAGSTCLLRNGADNMHFMKATLDTTEMAEDLNGLPHPIVVYSGMISDWMDWELLSYAGQQLPDYSFVFIGPRTTEIPIEIRKMSNLHFLGAKPYFELPSYLKGADVCMIPFKLGSLTRYVDPVKLYEYLASGKPVVSVLIPEVQRLALPGSVLVASTREGFVANLREATNVQAKDVRARLAFAKDNSWAARGKEVTEVINDRVITHPRARYNEEPFSQPIA